MTRRTLRTLTVSLPTVAVASLLLAANPLKLRTGARSAPLEWGIYQILWSRGYGRQVSTQVAKLASKPDYVMFFRDLSRPFPKPFIDEVAKHGATTIVSLELISWHGGHKGSYLPAVNAGEYDRFLRQWARSAKDGGQRVLLRFGFEFNGNWFSWCGAPQAYVAAWQHAHDIFEEAGATNVEWVWAANVVSCPDTPENHLHRYYPGDAYVDWIGVDGYNFGDHHDRWHVWQSFDEVFDATLTEFQKRYPGKPVMITEFACAEGDPGQRARWIRDAYTSLRRFPQVKAVVWFNYDKRSEGEHNWSLDGADGSLDAFNETFAAPRRLQE